MQKSRGRREHFAPAAFHSHRMIDKCLREERVPNVDERLVRVVHIIVEQYGGDVGAFLETIRYQADVIQRDEGIRHKAEAERHGFEH
jgi:hypothetical protein